jgi:hypothetical protein
MDKSENAELVSQDTTFRRKMNPLRCGEMSPTPQRLLRNVYERLRWNFAIRYRAELKMVFSTESVDGVAKNLFEF